MNMSIWDNIRSNSVSNPIKAINIVHQPVVRTQRQILRQTVQENRDALQPDSFKILERLRRQNQTQERRNQAERSRNSPNSQRHLNFENLSLQTLNKPMRCSRPPQGSRNGHLRSQSNSEFINFLQKAGSTLKKSKPDSGSNQPHETERMVTESSFELGAVKQALQESQNKVKMLKLQLRLKFSELSKIRKKLKESDRIIANLGSTDTNSLCLRVENEKLKSNLNRVIELLNQRKNPNPGKPAPKHSHCSKNGCSKAKKLMIDPSHHYYGSKPTKEVKKKDYDFEEKLRSKSWYNWRRSGCEVCSFTPKIFEDEIKHWIPKSVDQVVEKIEKELKLKSRQKRKLKVIEMKIPLLRLSWSFLHKINLFD